MQFADNSSTDPNDRLNLEFFVHCTLDIIDDKLNPASLAQTSTRVADLRGELYLGPLISNERYKA
jgi:hypothetical protein